MVTTRDIVGMNNKPIVPVTSQEGTQKSIDEHTCSSKILAKISREKHERTT